MRCPSPRTLTCFQEQGELTSHDTFACTTAPNQYNESETITKFEIMDGAPVRGETIPIRLFLGGFDLTPTFRDVNKKFSARYYLNLVLIDEENRRYFKQQEITVYRNQESGQ